MTVFLMRCCVYYLEGHFFKDHHSYLYCSISFYFIFSFLYKRKGVTSRDSCYPIGCRILYMCSQSCTGVLNEPTYGLKLSFVCVYKTRLFLYKATTLQPPRAIYCALPNQTSPRFFIVHFAAQEKITEI